MRELYVIEFESANYCGAHETCMVWAESILDAELKFAESGWGEQYFQDQDQEQYFEENGYEEGVIWSYTKRAVKLAGSEYEEYANKESQSSFYQIVNE